MFFNNKPTLADLIKDENIQAVLTYIHNNKSSVNVEIDSMLPLVYAILKDNIIIFNALLDNGADPMITNSSRSAGGRYIMSSCFFTRRFPTLELMFFHQKCGKEISDYFYKANEIEVNYYDDLALYDWFKELKKDLTGYYEANDEDRLRIIEKRIYRNREHIEFLKKTGHLDNSKEIINSKWLIDFLTGIRNEHRKVIKEKHGEELDRIIGGSIENQDDRNRLIEELLYSKDALRKAVEYIQNRSISVKEFLSEYKENKNLNIRSELDDNPSEIIRRMSEESSSNRSSNASNEVPVGSLIDFDDQNSGAITTIRHRKNN